MQCILLFLFILQNFSFSFFHIKITSHRISHQKNTQCHLKRYDLFSHFHQIKDMCLYNNQRKMVSSNSPKSIFAASFFLLALAYSFTGSKTIFRFTYWESQLSFASKFAGYITVQPCFSVVTFCFSSFSMVPNFSFFGLNLHCHNTLIFKTSG